MSAAGDGSPGEVDAGTRICGDALPRVRKWIEQLSFGGAVVEGLEGDGQREFQGGNHDT